MTSAFWNLATYLLNAGLFVLIGLELQVAVRALTGSGLTRGLIMVAAVALTLIVVRFVWLSITIFLIRLIDRRPAQRARRTTPRERVLQSFLGFRGAVSLAVALSIPENVGSGGAFPQRDLIVFVTAGVIAATLLQGSALPRLITWARLPADTGIDDERDAASRRATEAAVRALPAIAHRLAVDGSALEETQKEYERHLRVLGERAGADHDALVASRRDYLRLQRALIDHKQQTVIRLRDRGDIDDIVLRQIQTQLDAEAVQLDGRSQSM